MADRARILIVDDTPEVLEVFCAILRSAGHEVVVATSGSQALERVREHRPELVVLDVGLPDMSGTEVCRRIKADPLVPGVSVILVSGQFTEDRHKGQGLETGADDYLLKPVGGHELLARIRNLLRLRAANAALRASEERFRAIFASAPVGIAIYGKDRRYLQVNQSYCQMLGRTEAEMLGLEPMMVTHPEDVPEGEALLAEVFAGRRASYAREKRFVRKDGAIVTAHLSLAGIRALDRSVPLVVSMALDITEARLVERRVLQISAHERWRFSYDLHDGLGQHLAAVAMKAKCLEEEAHATSPKLEAEARELRAWVGRASAQARAIARGFDPVQVELGGLVPALERLARDSETLFPLRCQFNCGAPELKVAPEVSLHLYRIAQEAINNAARHGQAQRVDVTLTADADGLCLSIQDNGVGFPQGVSNGDGMGMRIVRFRANAIGAALACESQPGLGTKITCRLSASRLTANHHPAIRTV